MTGVVRAPGLRVRQREGEATRRALADRHRLRTDLAILKEEGHLVLPIVGTEDLENLPGDRVVREFPVVRSASASDYRGLLGWSKEVKALLPRSFDVVGDIVLIRLPDELTERRFEIGEALLAFVPSARIVGRDLGVHGAERLRTVERLAGDGGWRTRHRENGIEFDVDVERAYFSPRLAREHERVAAAVRDGEEVYDLCCGVGPFALTIARGGRAARVTAVDANPAAIALLRATRDRYPFGGCVEPVLATLEAFLPRARAVNRVVLNLPHEGIKYLPSVARTVAPRGSLHYYEITPREDADRRAESIMRSFGGEDWTIVDQHLVHPYAPTADLSAFTFARSKS